MNGNYSSSPIKESATGRPDRDPLATQDDPAKFLTQDSRTTGDGSARSTVEVLAEELAKPAVGDGDHDQDHQERRRVATRVVTIGIGRSMRAGRFPLTPDVDVERSRPATAIAISTDT